ncbi:MAG: hypothetical protein K2K26_03235 [Muribaculaceae bacterium]|nr:hypothetical protein [Muribaculaceae bacterium]
MSVFTVLVDKYKRREALSVSYDRRASIVTCMVLIVEIALVIACLFQMRLLVISDNGLHLKSVIATWPSPLLWVPLVLLCIITEIAFFMAPRSIKLDDNSIYINSTNWFRRLPFAKIEKIERYYEEQIAADRPLLCSYGFMGYWGRYRSSQFGIYHACYGDCLQCLVITMYDGRHYVIGCKDPEALLTQLNIIR